MNNQEKFAKLFKDFEDETKKKLNYQYRKIGECISKLEEKRYNPYFRERSFIEFCVNLRNVDFHNNNMDYYLITDATISKFEAILDEIRHPFKVINKATLNVVSRKANESVLDTMKEMNDKSYTHIPIYSEDEKELVGIFSENSLFQYVIEDKIIEIDEKTTFNDIKGCISFDKAKELVKFVSKDSLYDDVVNDFIDEFKKNNKLSCVMVTNSGKKTEKVMGILTTWDIIGR